MVLTSRSLSVVHATVGTPACIPHTTVPAAWSGVARRRHGPGVHSPSRQLSADFNVGFGFAEFLRVSRNRVALNLLDCERRAFGRPDDHIIGAEQHPPLTRASREVRA